MSVADTAERGGDMTMVQSGTGWDRLNDLLVAIKPGDMITPDNLVGQTGLSPEMVRTVLEALTRAGLFERTEMGVFIRRSLFSPPAS
jgi:predicted transcriptional regulator of viral defense system